MMKLRLPIIWMAALCLVACTGGEIPDTQAALVDLTLVPADTLVRVEARVAADAPVSKVSVEYALRSDFDPFEARLVPVDDGSRFSAVLSPLLPDTLYYLRFRLVNAQGSMLLAGCRQVRTRDLHYGLFGDHDAVDMGEGVLWSVANMGAARAELPGDFYSWAEVMPKTQFSLENYRWYSAGMYTKYSLNDGLYKLEDGDDAAVYAWQHGWRLPTVSEMQWLVDSCDPHPSAVDGHTGMLFTSPVNGATLFLPFAGIYHTGRYHPEGGYYLISDLDHPYDFNVEPDCCALAIIASDQGFGCGINSCARDWGMSIRPVHDR